MFQSPVAPIPTTLASKWKVAGSLTPLWGQTWAQMSAVVSASPAVCPPAPTKWSSFSSITFWPPVTYPTKVCWSVTMELFHPNTATKQTNKWINKYIDKQIYVQKSSCQPVEAGSLSTIIWNLGFYNIHQNGGACRNSEPLTVPIWLLNSKSP